nr:ovulation hormone [Lymnaea stagnalis]
LSITNDLRAIADSYLYDQHWLRERQEENLRRRFLEL